MRSPNPPVSISEIERQLADCIRNLYPLNVNIPRSKWPEAVENVLLQKLLPKEYANSELWRRAHRLYWQIRAR